MTDDILLHDAAALQRALGPLGDALREQGAQLATAESCTGGLIAALCTSVAGSSDWFDRGFVTYSNAAKTEQLGVPASLIDVHGAVSEEVARAMALGALAHSNADWAASVTGIAGPGGAVPGKPVGTVWVALAKRLTRESRGIPSSTGEVLRCECLHLGGDRTAVRSATVACVLSWLQAALSADA